MSEQDLEGLLREIKDTSELMMDLAYSSLLYSNQEIADEVLSMEETVREQVYEVQEEAVRRATEDKDIQKALATIRLVNSLEEISSAAIKIADVVDRSTGPYPVIQMSLRDADVIITTAEVGESSDLAGSTLGATKLASNSGMWVFAIRRGRRYIYGPDQRTSMMEGDILFARGPEDGEQYFKDLASGKEHLRVD